RTKRAQPCSDGGGGHTRLPHGERGRERIRDVVVPEEPELGAREQGLTPEVEATRARVIPSVRGAAQREQSAAARHSGRELEHRRLVPVQHPYLGGARVSKQQSLVRVVRLHARVAVEVVGGEVREDADLRRE